MRRLIDSADINLVPERLRPLLAASSLLDSTSDEMGLLEGGSERVGMTQPALERWLVQAHAYRDQVAADLGLLARLFSADVSELSAGVVHEAKRFSVIDDEEYGAIEVGCAVRLSVATTSLEANIEATIPNIAASAQLGFSDARIGISVVGYTGPLGDLLPAPKRLDVESCLDYMTAFEKIQALVFSESANKNVYPTLLSFDAP